MLARLLRGDFDRNVDNVGLTRSQWALIAVAARRPGSTQREIAELLEMSEASAGRLVDRLEADGMLERREREGDRRARAVYLTEAANPLLDRMGALARLREERWFRGISETQLQQTEEVLDRLYANVSAIAPPLPQTDC